MKTAAELSEEYGFWGDHPEFPSRTWRDEVADGDTRLGYWEWVAEKIENNA